MGYPSFMGPGGAAERIDIIRKAYEQTLNDPEFKVMMDKEQLDINPIKWRRIDRSRCAISFFYALPETAV